MPFLFTPLIRRLGILMGLSALSGTMALAETPAVDPTFGAAQIVSTPSGALAVFQTGQGDQTLVFWPPLFGDHTFYRQQAQSLAGHVRMVFIDGPGHGQSGAQTAGANLAVHADSVAAVMNHLKLNQAIFVGTSWGGLVGAQLARTQPERVKALVALNTPFAVDEANRPFAWSMIVWGARLMGSTDTFADGVAESYFATSSLTRRAAQVAEFKSHFAAYSHSVLSQVARTVLLERSNAMPWLNTIKVPTVVIGGHEDANITPQEVRQAAALIPGARYIDVAASAHATAVEAPERVNQVLLELTGAATGR